MTLFCKRPKLLVTALLILGFNLPMRPQSQTANTLPVLPSHSPNSWAGAQNRWRLTAVDPLHQVDGVDVQKRAARNAYWRPYLERFKAMEANGKKITMPDGAPPTPVEVIRYPDATWVVATFDHFLVIPIDSDDNLLYTEMNFDVDRVIKRPSNSSISSGTSFDVYVPGGRIKKSDGTTVSWLIQPSASSPQPLHRYIMEIRPIGIDHWIIAKRWDITSGVIKEHGSKLDGMNEDEAVESLLSVIAK